MNTPFKGFDTKEITLYAGEGVKPGTPVKIGENCTAVAAENGDKFCGVCTAVRGNYASVIMRGYVELIYSGDTPETGFIGLVADSLGGVMVNNSNGREYLAVCVDNNSSTVGILIN